MNDIENDSRFAPWKKEAQKRGYQSSASLPLVYKEDVIGTLNIYSHRTDVFGDDEIKFLMKMAGNIAIGINDLRMEKELQKSEERFVQFIDGLPVGVFVIDAEGKLVYASKKSKEIVGRRPGKYRRDRRSRKILGVGPGLISRDRLIHIHQRRSPAYRALLGESSTVDDMEIRRTEENIPLEVSGAPILNDKGQIIYGAITFKDISDRKHAEEQLSIREETVRSLLKAPLDTVCIIDLNGAILAINETGAKRLGKNVNDLLGTSLWDSLPPEVAVIRKAKVDEVISFKSPVRFEDVRGTMYLDNTFYPVFDSKDMVNRVVIFGRDITERKRTEERFKKLYSLINAIRSTNQSLVRIKDEHELFQQICNALAEVWYIKSAWIAISGKNLADMQIVAEAGFKEQDPPPLQVQWEYPEPSDGSTGAVIDSPKPFVIKDIENDPRYAPWKESLCKRGYNSYIALPLLNDKRVIGVLNICSDQKDAFGDEEMDFLIEVSEDIAFGVNRFRLEKQLEESEQRFAQFIEGQPVAVFVMDGKGRPVYQSRKAQQLLGKSIEEMGQDIKPDQLCEIFHAYVAGTNQRYPKDKMPLLRALAGEACTEEDIELRHPDKTIPLEVSSAPIFNEKGEVVYAVCALRDIIRKEACGQRTSGEKELLAITLRSISEGVIAADRQGRITLINKAAESLTGWTRTDALGESLVIGV